MLGHEAFRCRKCRHRFYASDPESPGTEPQAKPRSSKRRKHRDPWTRRRIFRRLVWIGIFAVAFLIFLFFLRFIVSEKTSSDSAAGSLIPARSVSCDA